MAIFAAPGAWAHSLNLPLSGTQLLIKTGGDPESNAVSLFMTDRDIVQLAHNPGAEGAALLVRGLGPDGGSTGLITLDPSKWEPVVLRKGDLRAYEYNDPTGGAGGITHVKIQQGQIRVRAKGENWPWRPGGAQDEIWAHLRLEDEWYCSRFSEETGARVRRNQADYFLASHAPPPMACPDELCGNGIRDFGEECDDGNLETGDGCEIDCTAGPCNAQNFDSTFEAIQSVVFDGYSCTNGICHGSETGSGGLSLLPDRAYDQLVSVAPTAGQHPARVFPSEPALSFLYEKLAAKTLPDVTTTLNPMPASTPIALSLEHLEAIEKWIRAGAPEDLVVEGTAGLLGTCLPPEDPLKAPVPEAPEHGVQLQQTAWSLPSGSEDELCMATYYDFTQTDLIPEEDQFDCPGGFGANNPSGKCFRWHRQSLVQDAQSHHSIIHIYTGQYAPDWVNPNQGGFPAPRQFGPYTYKHNALDHEDNGQPCDPLAIDPALGFNPGCSGPAVSNIACLSYGPPDLNSGFAGGGSTAPQFSGSQEPYYEQELAPGVFAVLPMSGVVVWNSHAFNLTDTDTTMAQYLNLEIAAPEDQLWPLRGIFDAEEIFWTPGFGGPDAPAVLPFETHEFCSSYTAPRNAYVFELSSHTHIRGVRWRTWAPPNTPCQIGDAACVPGPPERLIYVSTEYNDPTQLALDPPMVLDGPDPEDRTLLFCALFDNGSTPTSPPVKQYSTSPAPPLNLGPGGPCRLAEVACMSGPNKGMVCGGDDSLCDSAPGAGDGVCDACPVRGGLTTEDEMFLLLGSFYVPTPVCGIGFELALLLPPLAWYRRRRRARNG